MISHSRLLATNLLAVEVLRNIAASIVFWDQQKKTIILKYIENLHLHRFEILEGTKIFVGMNLDAVYTE